MYAAVPAAHWAAAEGHTTKFVNVQISIKQATKADATVRATPLPTCDSCAIVLCVPLLLWYYTFSMWLDQPNLHGALYVCAVHAYINATHNLSAFRRLKCDERHTTFGITEYTLNNFNLYTLLNPR